MADTVLLEPTDIAVDYQFLVNRLIHLMRTSSEPLTLHDLAEAAGLSTFHFARIFRSVTGIPPVEFQAALRFERAKALLLTTSASVTEICFEIGYGSLGTFSRRFKELVGITPAEFRAMPEKVAGMDLRSEVTRRSMRYPESGAVVEGDIVAPLGTAHIYIGLFPERIAASQPVVGQMLPEPGHYLLPGPPPGRYHLMAAALPADGNPLSHLLPSDAFQVAAGGAVEIGSGTDCIFRSLLLRPVQAHEAPVLTALPALLL